MAPMKKVKLAVRRSSARTKGTPKDVDEYLASIPEPACGMLKKMRTAIRAAAPREATESISYGIPALKYRDMSIWFAAFKKHCSLFPGAAVLKTLESEVKGCKTSKGTIQFPLDKPLPIALVKKLVEARVALAEEE
jgi:uncharacterized protein YdhG (YjbR/CyaY superfamily)